MPTLEAPWEKLQGLLREKQARFEHLASIRTKSGQRAMTEESDELGYVWRYSVNRDTPNGEIVGFPSHLEKLDDRLSRR